MIANVSLALVSASFRAAVASWPVVPQPWKRAAGTAIPLSECAVAFAGNPGMAPLGLGLAIAVLGVFVAVQSVMAVRGVEADCGCISQGRQIGAFSILRAAALGVIPAVGLLSLAV